jgi:hypothetical protein
MKSMITWQDPTQMSVSHWIRAELATKYQIKQSWLLTLTLGIIQSAAGR